MHKSNPRAKITSVQAASCAAILGGILAAGLWPFHAPKNEVAWLARTSGLRFGRHGTILSSGTFKKVSRGDEASCSLELWLAPGLTSDTATLLAFYRPHDPSGLSLRQWDRNLVVERETWSHYNHTRNSGIQVDDIFRQAQFVFIAVTSHGHETAVYANGVLAQESRYFAFTAKDLSGRLVVANSPVANDSWTGELRGLALYNRELTGAQVMRHYETWTQTGRPDVTTGERAVALYLFDEYSGSVIRNHAGSGVNLYIPERYLELHQIFLEPPWNGYYPGWGYWKDVLINIGGFVPLGFFFCGYLSLVLPRRRAALATVILGTVVSLSIEILQAYLPTRDSGMTDVITNTLGTGAGVALYRYTSFVWQSFSGGSYPKVDRLARLFLNCQNSETDETPVAQPAVGGM